MVLVQIRVRQKSGYHYPEKYIKEVTLHHHDRLEELLQKSQENGGGSSTSSHAALYLNGRELPLNTSVASHNLDDGVILETCKSPSCSAALSAVLRDIDEIRKVSEKDRTIQTIRNALEVPDDMLWNDDGDEDKDNGKSSNGWFWDVNRWTDEMIKKRIICLATMKKILQRDDRYATHDLPFCTDIQSLHFNIQKAFDRDNDGDNRRRWNQIGSLFSPSTKRNGKPSTIYILIAQKLDVQVRVAANSTGRTVGAVVGDGISIDGLDEFIRIDMLRHKGGNSTSTAATGSSSNTPRRRRRRAKTTNHTSINIAIDETDNTNNGQSITERRRGRRKYCPEYASGPFAVLCAMMEAQEGRHGLNFNDRGSRRRLLSLSESQVKRLAQPRCRSNLYDRAIYRGSRSAFACMEQLVERKFVRKELISSEEKWQLLPEGDAMAKSCLEFEGAVKSAIHLFQDEFNDSNEPIPIVIEGHNEKDITLLVDNREDSLYRERIHIRSQDCNVKIEERELPAGDYLFLQQNKPEHEEVVIPIVIERKSWSDLADSVMSKGRERRRLDCVSIGSNYICCPHANCQLCKMKRSGCTQILFIIEGGRCRGSNDHDDSVTRTNNKKCSKEKRCRACQALIDRHGQDVTQEALEKVLTRLQVLHGCHVHFTRSYNETITSLFTIRHILNEEKALFANTLLSQMSDRGNLEDNNSKNLNYQTFCSNTRSSQTPMKDLRRNFSNDFMELSSISLFEIVSHSRNQWRKEVMNQLIDNDEDAKIDLPEEVIDSNHSQDEVIELNDSQELVKNDDGTVNLLESDDEEDVEIINIEESQDSIQIIDVVNVSVNNTGRDKGKGNTAANSNQTCKVTPDEDEGDIILLEDSQDSLQVAGGVDFRPAGGSMVEKNRKNQGTEEVGAARLEQKRKLLVLHGYYDYDDRFHNHLHSIWRECFERRNSEDVSSNGQDVEQTVSNITNSSQFPFIERSSAMFIFLWIQIRLGLLLRIASSKSQCSEELKVSWVDTSISRNVSNIFDSTSEGTLQRLQSDAFSSPASPPIPTQMSPAVRSQSMSRNIAQTTDALSSTSSTYKRSQPSMSICQLPPKRAKLIEARLKRFESSPIKLSQQHRKSPDITSFSTWSCTKCTFVNNDNVTECVVCTNSRLSLKNSINSHPTAMKVPKPSLAAPSTAISSCTWRCVKCTFDNNDDVKECDICGHSRFSSGASTKCKPVAVKGDSLLPASLSSGIDQPLPATTSSATMRKARKLPRCGACGKIGHNRGSATAQNCLSYYDEKEVELREKKQRKILQNAIEAERDYVILQREEQSRQDQAERLKAEFEAMSKHIESSKKINEAEIIRRRKKADAARRRANRL